MYSLCQLNGSFGVHCTLLACAASEIRTEGIASSVVISLDSRYGFLIKPVHMCNAYLEYYAIKICLPNS